MDTPVETLASGGSAETSGGDSNAWSSVRLWAVDRIWGLTSILVDSTGLSHHSHWSCKRLFPPAWSPLLILSFPFLKCVSRREEQGWGSRKLQRSVHM